MRTRFRLIALLVAGALLSACASGGVRSVPPLSPAVRLASGGARGTIDALSRVTKITKAQMMQGLYGKVIDELGGKPACDVILYSITYETIGVNGESANASAAFFVPDVGCKGPYPLVGYAHGTNPVKEQLITQPSTTSATWTAPDQDPIVVAAIFAAHGYATAATDYLGLGLSTYPFHPYLVADAEASAVIDSLRAARNAAARLGITLSKEVFLSGHSQGGQSAVATQRAIEAAGGREFDLRGDAPSSGPYALTQTFEDSLNKQSQDAPILAAYILPGYQKTYGNVYTHPEAIFKAPYAAGIDTLLPVQTYKQEAKLYGQTLPLKLQVLLRGRFFKSFLNDPTSGARVDTARNDLIGGWLPKAPVYLCGGNADPEVEYKNSQAAYAYFTAHKVSATLVDVGPYIPASVPMVDYHVVVALFCLPLARAHFFDLMK